MAIEINMLAWSIILGFVHIVVASTLSTQQRGVKWNAGNREGEPKPLTGAAGRAVRASLNFLETFAFFAAAALALVVTQRNTPHTALGAEIYVWSRLVYLAVYLIGVPYLRTLVWMASLVGLLLMVAGLF